MKIIIDIPEKTYQKIKEGIYDYGDMNVIIQNGTPYEERPHGDWIPCSERLPEEYHTYLVTKLDPNPSKSTFTTLAYFYTEETGWDIDDVIAWMPFPKPYRKEGDQE